jgi:hypothetical protein
MSLTSRQESVVDVERKSLKNRESWIEDWERFAEVLLLVSSCDRKSTYSIAALFFELC